MNFGIDNNGGNILIKMKKMIKMIMTIVYNLNQILNEMDLTDLVVDKFEFGSLVAL